jgi:rod shape-determining protein MreD
MQTSYSSSRILLPVRPWFIGFSLLAGAAAELPADCGLARRARLAGLADRFLERSRAPPGRHGAGFSFRTGDGRCRCQLCSDSTRWPTSGGLWRVIAVAPDPLVSAGAAGLAGLSAALAGAGGAVQRAHAGRRRFAGHGLFHRAMFRDAAVALLTFVLLLPQHQPVDRDANRPL